MAGIGIFNKINAWDKSLETYFHPPKNLAIKGAGSTRTAISNSVRKAGGVSNDLIYRASNKLGNKMLTTLKNTGSGWGKYLSRVPGIGKLASGMAKLGTKTGGKIPGIGTLFILGTAAASVFKAGKELLSGKPGHAGHTILQSAGSLLGLAAGTALMMTGVGLIPGLALAMGTGFAGDWLGKKVANTVFSKAGQEKEAMAQAKLMQRQMAAQGINYQFANQANAQYQTQAQGPVVVPMGQEMQQFFSKYGVSSN